MEIKRTYEMSVATDRRYTIHRSTLGEQMDCSECRSAMITAAHAAVMFGVSQRTIFRHIEANLIHFAEIVSGAVMVCLPSLRDAIDRFPATRQLGE